MKLISYLKKVDYVLLVVVLLLSAIGIAAIGVATNTDNFLAGDSADFIFRQAVALSLGLTGMLIVMSIDYKVLGRHWMLIFAVCILLLLAVYVPGLGIVNKGSRRWINMGFMEFQTSEIVKIGFIIVMAKILEIRKNKLNSIFDILVIFAAVLAFVSLVFIQPDLGQSLVYIVIASGMVFVAGINMKIVFGALGAIIIIAPILWNFMMEDYQKNRIIYFLNPTLDPLGQGYHTIQSIITVGSGEVFGKGLNAQNTMTSLNYLPAQWTDFIFSVISESAGFVGGSVVVLLFGLMLFRLLRDARAAKDEFGTLIIVGVFFMFAFQIFENIGMTLGLMPITGITLPFLSYGGSSLMTNLIAVGLVLGVHMRRHSINF
ncbi:rod shape-determining protein RodA [Alkalibacter saccharofermentans]|uniref:Peptidoglycan glycosyltransferase RodA n=1 Tax=Alkalibacter saccharofermentans DSM 14828 TaxID=1120975 RepID=A0A1M4UAR7_9FIRM|nr:rod shape-determining protein RodA [Alkalibacter saccharofermentans]SHE53971.1 rod shape determining protein RodA [Alkalibacter saccharofermentans DSM 14828]